MQYITNMTGSTKTPLEVGIVPCYMIQFNDMDGNIHFPYWNILLLLLFFDCDEIESPEFEASDFLYDRQVDIFNQMSPIL